MNAQSGMNEHQVILQLLEVCRVLHAKNLLAAGDGNVSYRMADHRILITPRGRNKAFLKASDIAIIDIKDRVVRGEPSSELRIHTEIYRSCPEARCVVHAHPPSAVAWTLAHAELKELPSDVLPEIVLGAGGIPVVDYARPGTPELSEGLKPFLPHRRAMILARHGAVSWGESVLEALNGMERIEHSALILWYAQTMGGYAPMSESELKALRDAREQGGGYNM
jgi:L-fuculose-phosphate aldolase